MRNVILIITEILLSYISLIILAKKYKTDGIYIFGIIATIISCIMNLKQITIMNINIPIGLGITSSLLIVGNLLTQTKGKEEIKNYLLIMTITFIISYIIISLSSYIEISEFNYYANKSYDIIFTNNLRASLALIISLIISIYTSSNLYYTIKRIQNKIVYSNIFSVIISSFIENIIFVIILYLYTYSPIDIFLSIVLRYMIKTIILLFGTITIYITNKYNY